MGRGEKRSFRDWLRIAQIPLVVLALILVLARLVLPFAIRDYVNRQLREVHEYGGEVGAIHVNLWRGAYEIIDLRLVKTDGKIPVPFVRIPHMDLSIEWRQLLNGALVAKIEMIRPELNFVTGPTDAQKQTGVDKSWKQTLESLFPFTINRFEIHDGVIRYADPHQQPPVDLYITNLFAVATNLTNVEDKELALPSGVIARGETLGGGELGLDLRLNPLADQPTFKLAASLTGVELEALNDFLRAYSASDAEGGRFWVYASIAAADGRYQGFVKPFFLDVNILEWEEVRRQNIFQTFWESLVAGVTELFENQAEDQVATRVPITGEFEQGTQIDIWTTLGGILRNAFLQAIAPGVPGPVQLPGGSNGAASPPGNDNAITPGQESKESP